MDFLTLIVNYYNIQGEEKYQKPNNSNILKSINLKKVEIYFFATFKTKIPPLNMLRASQIL